MYRRDLTCSCSSAIASSVALGEASSQKLASPFSDLPNDTATITASTDGDAQYKNGIIANHEAQISESEAVSSSKSHEEARQTKSVDTALAHDVPSSNHTAVGLAAGASTMPQERHTSDEMVYYAPMSDSEPEDGFQAEMMVPAIPLEVLPSTTQANPSMQEEEMIRSPSVSYVGPDEDLAIEQDGEGMMDVPLPSVEAQVNTEVQATSVTQALEQVTQADTTRESAEIHPEASIGSPGRIVNKPTPPQSPLHRRLSGTPEANTPADQGWGISGQGTPAQTPAYDEQDELDELAGGTPRSPNAASIAQATGSQSRISTANGTLSPVPASPNKGKHRARDEGEDMGARVSPPASSSHPSGIVFNGVADDEQTSPSKVDKGKARARETTPLPASQALSNFRSRATATPSSATTHTSPRALRPAAVRRKYRGLDRFKAAAYLSLDRPEVYLDVAMEDDDKTCWIRCVHWQPEGDDSEQSSDDTDTVTVSARPAAETARRARQRRIQQAGRTAGTSEQVNEKKVICSAEVLGELMDDDYAADKWRVLRINNEHSTACEMIMQQTKANEVLESAHIDIQAEDDPELAADILAAKFKEDNDEEMDPALEQAIRESLIEAKKLENSQLEDDFPPYVEEDFNARPDQSTNANLALTDEDLYAANASQAGPSGTRNTAESPQPSLMEKDDEASLPPLNQADNSASKESEGRNLRSPSPRLPPSLRPGGATSPAASRTEPVTKPYSLMEASTEVSTSKIESGQNQPDDNARSQASHDRSYNSRPARAFSTDVTFCGRPHLEKSIKRVLERKGSDLVLFEDIEGNMTILRFYCKNHEEAIGYSTSGRLDAHMASSSTGDGTQAATCTAFVKAEKQEDIDHW